MSGEWPIVKLGSVAAIEIGGTPSRERAEYWAHEGQGQPWVSIRDLKGREVGHTNETITQLGVTRSNTKLVPAGTVLMSFKLSIGRVAYAAKDLYTNEAIAAFYPASEVVMREWLYHLLPRISQSNDTDQAIKGVTLNKQKLKNLELPLPTLSEQRRIAAILDTLDRTIEATQRIVSKLQAARQGLLHDLLTRGLDEHGQLRDPQRHPEQFKDTALGRVPVGWEMTRLLEHVELPSGQVNPQQDPYRSMPLVAADYIESRTGRLLNVETAEQQGAMSGKYVFHSGDVLYSKIRPNLRKATLVQFNGICSADMYPLQSKSTISPEYLILVVLGEHFSRFAEAVSMRSGFPKINRDELGDYQLVLPQLDEQQRIATKVGGVNNRIAAEQAQLAKLQTLKRGLIEDLLTGWVRVAGAGRGFEDKDADAAVQRVTAELPSSGLPPMPPPLPAAPQHRAMYRVGAGASPEAMSEWTQQLWDAAQSQQVGPYSHAALDAVLPQLAAASSERAGVERIPELLAGAGVRFMLLPHPRGSKASGAAFYLDDGRTQPVVGLSLRYPLLDVFWFNLFHELGHIRLGHEPVLEEALDSDSHDPKSPDEQAADAFARQTLIPEAVWQPFLKGGQHSSNRIKRLARGLNRHPATVAGRLAFDTQDWRRFNAPELRPNIGQELRALMAQLGTMQEPRDP